MKSMSNDKGFSFIDVVVAAVILALAVLPVCSGFLSVAQSDAQLRRRAAVNRILVNELERVKATGKFGDIILMSAEEYADDSLSEKAVYLLVADELGDDTVITMTIEKKCIKSGGETITAYIEFILTYDGGTSDDTEDDISLKGVYVP